MRLPLAIAAVALFTAPAFAQDMSCADFTAMSVDEQVAAVAAMDGASTPTQPQDSAKPTSQDNQVDEARREPDAIAQQIRDICGEKPDYTAMQAAQEAATNRVNN